MIEVSKVAGHYKAGGGKGKGEQEGGKQRRDSKSDGPSRVQHVPELTIYGNPNPNVFFDFRKISKYGNSCLYMVIRVRVTS
jgi:hypothetical protein